MSSLFYHNFDVYRFYYQNFDTQGCGSSKKTIKNQNIEVFPTSPSIYRDKDYIGVIESGRIGRFVLSRNSIYRSSIYRGPTVYTNRRVWLKVNTAKVSDSVSKKQFNPNYLAVCIVFKNFEGFFSVVRLWLF